MVNKARAKGTLFENDVLKDLQSIWPQTSRSSAGQQSNDFHGPPFPIEAKKRAVWALKEWIRCIDWIATGDLHNDGDKWAIFASEGDKRKALTVPDVVVFPRPFALELLASYYLPAYQQ